MISMSPDIPGEFLYQITVRARRPPCGMPSAREDKHASRPIGQAAGRGSPVPTRMTPGRGDMCPRARDIVAPRREGADRTAREARTLDARITRACTPLYRRQFKIFPEGQRPAIGVPEPVVGMDEDAEGRRRHAIGLHGPALERPPGRAAEGKERRCAAAGGQRLEDAPGPAVERMKARHRPVRATLRRPARGRRPDCRAAGSCRRPRPPGKRRRAHPAGRDETRRATPSRGASALAESAPRSAMAEARATRARGVKPFVPLVRHRLCPDCRPKKRGHPGGDHGS